MIIYSLVCNNGGMLRVTESLAEIFNYVPLDFPLRIFIFSDEKPLHVDDDRFVFFKLSSSTQTEWEESYLRLSGEVEDYLQDQEVHWIVADFMTLEFFKNIQAQLCYDVHFLGRPFYNALERDKLSMSIDSFLGSWFILGLHMNQFSFLKQEYKFLKQASCFISNSPSTTHILQTLYQDVTKDKIISYIPVSSSLREYENEEHEKEIISAPISKFYFHGRCHPQKGIQFLMREKWTHGLTLRGFEQRILSPDRLKWLADKGIEARAWSSDSSIIRKEIMDHDIILFPSIYEPWGLSLQEALALGKICVANINAGGHEDQIIHAKNGFLLDFRAENLEKRILDLVASHSEEHAQIKQNAKASSTLGHVNRQKLLAEFFIKLLK